MKQTKEIETRGSEDTVQQVAKPQLTRTYSPTLSEQLLKALKLLSTNYVPHDCGGFTTDDMQWRLGTAFIEDKELYEALDELTERKLIRYAGYDEKDAKGHCYELAVELREEAK